MIKKQLGRKHIWQIMRNRSNMMTTFRIVLIYISIVLYNSLPQISCISIVFSVLLDWFFLSIARKTWPCTFSGDCLSWLAAILTHTVVLLWWFELQPQLITLISSLLMAQVITMLLDLIAKSYSFRTKFQLNTYIGFMSMNKMFCKDRDYDCRGLGPWNQTFHVICILSRILYLKNSSIICLVLFYINLPLSVSYFWMNLTYVKYILDSWNEGKRNGRIVLDFNS